MGQRKNEVGVDTSRARLGIDSHLPGISQPLLLIGWRQASLASTASISARCSGV
jgi:hypothetical protein